MHRFMLGIGALLTLFAVAATTDASPRNYASNGAYGDGYWHKGYGWAGYGWYSIYGDYQGYGDSSLGYSTRGIYGGKPPYMPVPWEYGREYVRNCHRGY
ncbi:MAG TPA: hypothetical protein VHV77_11470 [Pirellulales bacterium]|nr:hypothetical protein [Pirellulales bacterium]